MARAQTYIIDDGGLFFFCLPRYPNISIFKKKFVTSFGILKKPSLVVFAAMIEYPTQDNQFEI
jgi:hypothetical protein